MREIATKDKILDTAEKLFAAEGFAGTSLRAIIKTAGVNTAAVHYHFGSKDALIEAVLVRRAAPLNEDRIRLLDEHEARYPSGKLPIEGVIEAFLAPVMRVRPDARDGAELFPQLMGRAIAEPDERVGPLFQNIFGDVFDRFQSAFARALPDLSPEELQWRIHLMVGAMAFTAAVPKIQASVPRQLDESTGRDRMTSRLVGFLAAGMRAPAASTPERNER